MHLSLLSFPKQTLGELFLAQSNFLCILDVVKGFKTGCECNAILSSASLISHFFIQTSGSMFGELFIVRFLSLRFRFIRRMIQTSCVLLLSSDCVNIFNQISACGGEAHAVILSTFLQLCWQNMIRQIICMCRTSRSTVMVKGQPTKQMKPMNKALHNWSNSENSCHVAFVMHFEEKITVCGLKLSSFNIYVKRAIIEYSYRSVQGFLKLTHPLNGYVLLILQLPLIQTEARAASVTNSLSCQKCEFRLKVPEDKHLRPTSQILQFLCASLYARCD